MDWDRIQRVLSPAEEAEILSLEGIKPPRAVAEEFGIERWHVLMLWDREPAVTAQQDADEDPNDD